jgi:hypothetical protein
MVAKQEFLADLIPVGSDLPKDTQGIETGDGNDGQEAAKTNDKRNAGAEYKPVKFRIETHIRVAARLSHAARLTQENAGATGLLAHSLKNTGSLVYSVARIPFTVCDVPIHMA